MTRGGRRQELADQVDGFWGDRLGSRGGSAVLEDVEGCGDRRRGAAGARRLDGGRK